MKKTDLKSSNVVLTRNGNYGVVVAFNGKAEYIVFKNYVSTISKYKEDMTHSNNNYDIVKVLDGSSINEAKNVFKTSFKGEGLTILWEE